MSSPSFQNRPSDDQWEATRARDQRSLERKRSFGQSVAESKPVALEITNCSILHSKSGYKMNLGGFLIFLSLVLHITFAFDERLFKPIHDAKAGLFDLITNPKIPKIPVIHVEKHIGPGSFGFGFGIGFGGQSVPSSESGVNLPPKDKPDVTWEDKNKDRFVPRPNWEEEKVEKTKPGSYDNDKEDSKIESYEKDKKDKKPDWEEIGEVDEERLSEDLMNGELVVDGLIHPRNNRDRVKRFIDSKVYHVALKFMSNAKPGNKVKVYNSLNSLENEHSGM